MPKKKTKRKPQPLADFTLADQIREAREKANLTRHELAEACDVDYMTVARWEWGWNAPTAANLMAIGATCEYVFRPAT